MSHEDKGRSAIVGEIWRREKRPAEGLVVAVGHEAERRELPWRSEGMLVENLLREIKICCSFYDLFLKLLEEIDRILEFFF